MTAATKVTVGTVETGVIVETGVTVETVDWSDSGECRLE